MKKDKPKNPKTKKILSFVLAIFALAFAAYICILVLPYSGKLKISEAAKKARPPASFFGDSYTNERVFLLDEGRDAFLHRLNIIEKAQNEIYFCSFSTDKGTSADIVFKALLTAADRGVKVNIILDGKSKGVDKRTEYALIAHQNVQYYLYNPINFFAPANINISMHDKFLTVDNRYMIFGGRNIGDINFNPPEYEGKLKFDRETFVFNADGQNEGIIQRVKEYFNELCTDKLTKHKTKISNKKKQRGIEHIKSIASYGAYLESINFDEIDYAALTVPTKKISLLHNPTSQRKKEPHIGYTLLQLAKNSQKTTIQTPYTVLTKQALEQLETIVDEGRELTILTNSLASAPNIAFSVYMKDRKRLLKTGASIYEYQLANIHAKTYVFDQRLVANGSFNLDERSIRIDTESMLVIDSEEFCDLVQKNMQGYFDKSLKVNDQNKYDTQGEPISLGKKALFATLALTLYPIKYLL